MGAAQIIGGGRAAHTSYVHRIVVGKPISCTYLAKNDPIGRYSEGMYAGTAIECSFVVHTGYVQRAGPESTWKQTFLPEEACRGVLCVPNSWLLFVAGSIPYTIRVVFVYESLFFDPSYTKGAVFVYESLFFGPSYTIRADFVYESLFFDSSYTKGAVFVLGKA